MIPLTPFQQAIERRRLGIVLPPRQRAGAGVTQAELDDALADVVEAAELAAEVTARSDGQASLDARLDVLEAADLLTQLEADTLYWSLTTPLATEADLTSEINTRAAGDVALDARLDIIEAVSIATDSELGAEAALARNADNLTSGTVADLRIAGTIARDSEVTAAVAAEAALARNADNLTSGTVADTRIASTIARDSEVTAAVASEAALARNADNLTSGTVADVRIAATIARDSEVTSAVAAEAALARNGDNITSGTVADARIAATIARTSAVNALGTYQTYVPVVSQNGARTTSGVVARYTQIGKMVHVIVKATITNAGAVAQALTVTLPVAASAAIVGLYVGDGWIGDLSATDQWNVSSRIASTTTLDFYATSVTNQSPWGVNPSLAVANGDVISFSATYEAA